MIVINDRFMMEALDELDRKLRSKLSDNTRTTLEAYFDLGRSNMRYDNSKEERVPCNSNTLVFIDNNGTEDAIDSKVLGELSEYFDTLSKAVELIELETKQPPEQKYSKCLDGIQETQAYVNFINAFTL